MEGAPKILALEYDEAIDRCEKAGWNVRVLFTGPPSDKPGGKLRVVRFKKLAPHEAILTVAREQT